MISIIDNKRRVTLPRSAKPGQAVDVSETGTGYKLDRLDPATPPKARIVVKNGRKYLTNDRVMTYDDIENVMAQFP